MSRRAAQVHRLGDRASREKAGFEMIRTNPSWVNEQVAHAASLRPPNQRSRSPRAVIVLLAEEGRQDIDVEERRLHGRSSRSWSTRRL